MIISRNLIAEFLGGIEDCSIDQLITDLFRSGIEVERYEKIVSPEGVFYGLVKSVGKVEGSNKLNLCKVYVPVKDQEFDIVCGASNVVEGLRVVVALPGAKLLNGTFEIGIREFASVGIKSYGMICGYSELSKSTILKSLATFEKGRIIDLGEGWDINKPFNPEDLWLNDWILDISIPANRGDLHSVFGISRELAKTWGRPIEDLKNGGTYRKEDSVWLLKRALVMNGFADKVEGDFEKDLSTYAYIAFNEDVSNRGLTVRKKNEYFLNACKSFISNQPLTPFTHKKLSIDVNKMTKFLGFDISPLCNSLSTNPLFTFKGDHFLVPEWRDDLNHERDIAAELLSFVDCNAIKSEPIPILFSDVSVNKQLLSIEQLREFWRSWGLYECTTFNLQKSNVSGVSVAKPISNHHIFMRCNAIEELMDVISENYRSKRDLHPVFEIFDVNNEGDAHKTLNIVSPICKDNLSKFPINETKISFDLCDLQALIRKSMKYFDVDIEFVLGDKEGILSRFKYLDAENTWLIKDKSSKQVLGWIGYIKQKSPYQIVGSFIKLPKPTEITPHIPSPSKFPPSYQDVSIEIPKDSNIYISDVMNSLSSPNLISSKLIESQDNSRYLIRLKFQSFEKTLTKEEIKNNVEQIYLTLNKLSILIR